MNKPFQNDVSNDGCEIIKREEKKNRERERKNHKQKNKIFIV